MKTLISRLMIFSTVALIAGSALAQQTTPIKANQTQGFGEGKVLKFTYTQNFDCIDQPNDDLNYNKIKAASDPGEMQTPICVVGTQPSINPPGQKGNPANTTEPLYVLVPMFSVDNDKNPDDAISCKDVVQGTLCGPALGKTLIKLFGAIPEGFKAKPMVFTQCPDANLRPGTCTMHASRLDLGPVLAALGYIPPPTSNVFLPTPNHSHVVINQDINIKAIWWQVIPVLVLKQSDWPPQDGSSGITSLAAIREAEKAKEAVEAPSNFFLFFSSYTMADMN
ncbi:MAG: hypothetical protein ABSC15_02130 [Terriglobales bacterium]|jgi:hypothetical protein